MSAPELWTNKKTGDLYWLLGYGIDATNARDGLRVAIYCNGKRDLYSREVSEFMEKFRPE